MAMKNMHFLSLILLLSCYGASSMHMSKRDSGSSSDEAYIGKVYVIATDEIQKFLPPHSIDSEARINYVSYNNVGGYRIRWGIGKEIRAEEGSPFLYVDVVNNIKQPLELDNKKFFDLLAELCPQK